MKGLLAAALAESALITFRDLTKPQQTSDGASVKLSFPLPSDFVAVAVIYGGLALFPESASTFTSMFGWGLVLATAFNVWDPAHPTGKKAAPPSPSKATVGR